MTITPDQIIADQQNLNTKYSDYNQAYLSYQTCIQTKNNGHTIDCTGTIKTNYENKELDLNTAITTMKTNITTYKNQSQPSSPAITTSYTDMTTLRNNVDTKLQQLQQLTQLPNTSTNQLDITVYSGILWTILATTLIYYVFIHL